MKLSIIWENDLLNVIFIHFMQRKDDKIDYREVKLVINYPTVRKVTKSEPRNLISEVKCELP